MKRLLNRYPWFNSQRRRALRKWLLRVAAFTIAIDALGVFIFHLIRFNNPVLVEHVAEAMHMSGTFGSFCGACALVVSETHEFLD